MIVACPKCATSYDFDETLVGPKGTVVRCTSCSHMFKIFQDEGDDVIEHAGWMIRKTSGKVFGIDKFSTIQKWVREGKIGPDDSLSRTGATWKKLSEIVELQGLFAGLASTKLAQDPGPTRPALAAPAKEPRLLVHADAPAEEPSRPAARGPVRQDQSWESHAKPARPVQDLKYEVPEAEPGTVKGPLARSLEVQETERLSSDDKLLMPGYKPGRWKRWAVALVVLAVIGAGVAGYFQRVRIIGWLSGLRSPATEGERDKAIERAHEYFLLDTTSYFDQAEKIFRDLLATDDQDMRARAGLAELLAVRAQYAKDRKNIFGDEESVEDAGTMAREALKLAQLAVLSSPDDVEANRALADALRLAGDLEAARKYINKALDIAPRDPETMYVAVLIDHDEGLGIDKAIEELERILKRSESLLRVRYRLALLLAIAGRSDAAGAQARKILETNADHMLATRLIDAMKAGTLKTAETRVATAPAADAAASVEPDAVPDTGTAPDVRPPDVGTKPPPPPGDVEFVPGGKSLDFYLTKAQKLRSSGNCTSALDYFEKALQVDPSSTEAHTGSGHCYMSTGQYGPAVSEFKRALDYNKSYGPAIIGLAQAYEKKGNLKGAKDYYTKYLDHFSSGPDANLARNKLEELKDTIGPEDEPSLEPEAGEKPKVVPVEVEEEVEIKGSAGQPSGDTPTTAGDPYP